MAEGYTLTCTTAPVEGQCPSGSEMWVSTSSLDPFAMPSQEVLTAAFVNAFNAFFVPSMIVLCACLAVRWIMEMVR